MTALIEAARHGADLGILFVVLAIVAFAAAIYVVVQLNNWIGGIVLALIGILILYFAA